MSLVLYSKLLRYRPQLPIKYLPNKTELCYELAWSKLTSEDSSSMIANAMCAYWGAFFQLNMQVFHLTAAVYLNMVIHIQMITRKVNNFKLRQNFNIIFHVGGANWKVYISPKANYQKVTWVLPTLYIMRNKSTRILNINKKRLLNCEKQQ